MFLQMLRRSFQVSTGCKNVPVRLCSTVSEPKLAPTIEEHSKFLSIRLGIEIHISSQINHIEYSFRYSQCESDRKSSEHILSQQRSGCVLHKLSL